MDASQPRKHSLLESVVNILVGLVINIFAQALVFPMFGVYVPFSSNLKIAGVFTVISIARSYGLRRIFNAFHVNLVTKSPRHYETIRVRSH
jgi:hypothetical protein